MCRSFCDPRFSFQLYNIKEVKKSIQSEESSSSLIGKDIHLNSQVFMI